MSSTRIRKVSVILVCVGIAVATFILDLVIPLGVAAGAIYVALVLVSQWAHRAAIVYSAALVGTFLTILGYFLSPSGGVAWMVVANRVLILLVIWLTAILCSERIQAENDLVAVNEGLDALVRERTVHLYENETKLRAILNTTVDGIITIDDQGFIHSFNQAAERIFGYDAEEAIGRNVNLLMPSPHQAKHEQHIVDYLRTGESVGMGRKREVLGLRKDGTSFPLAIGISEAKLADRSLFTGVVRDITMQKQTEQDLIEKERKLSTMINNLSGMVYRCALDKNWTMEYVSKACKQITGYETQELIGNRIVSYNEIIQPEHRHQVRQGVQHSIDKRRSFELEYSIRTKSGETRWVLERGIGIFLEDGRAEALEGCISDISDRKRAVSEATSLGRILEESFNEVYIFDANDLHFIQVNRGGRKNLGYSLKELQTRTPLDINPTYSRTTYEQLLEPLRQGKREVIKFSSTHKRKNKTSYPVDVNLQRSTFGEIPAFVAIVLDATERVRAEQELRIANELLEARVEERTAALKASNSDLARSNEELDNFAYIASHDLKEPLRGIHDYSTFLLEDYSDKLDEEGCSKLKTLVQLTQRLDKLINGLLFYSRVGRQDLALRETDLNELVAEVIDSLSVRLDEIGVAIRVSTSLPVIRGHELFIREVFNNLITNSMKYNDKEEKWIEVGCHKPGEAPTDNRCSNHSKHHVFYVRDNGIGIKEKDVDKVFRIFKRLHGRDKYGGGSGAGLTLTRRMITRHGGHIWIASTPGEGTTFYFTLEGEQA